MQNYDISHDCSFVSQSHRQTVEIRYPSGRKASGSLSRLYLTAQGPLIGVTLGQQHEERTMGAMDGRREKNPEAG